jgi:hypothetical protein
VANAEAEAKRMVAEATEVAERLVTEATEVSEQAQARADALLAERTAEAEAASAALRERTEQQVAAALDKVRADAEVLTEQARTEGRVMVEEAQQLRARVLADLSRRRKVLHAQIEQLRAGRERLAETIDDVKRSVESIADDLFNAENEARLAAEIAGREVAERPDEGSPEELATALLAEEAEADAATAAEADAATAAEADGAPDEAVAVEESGPAEAPGEAPAPPVEQVDALFAKLRASQGDAGAGGPEADESAPDTEDDPETGSTEEVGDGGDGPPEARHPLAVQRDELIAPLVTGLSRRLKRLLQDNQNDLLDALRAKGATWSPDLLPDETEHLDAFSTAALPLIEEAADAGVALVGPDGTRPDGDTLVAVSHDLAEAVVGPLRKKLTAGDDLGSADEAMVSEHVGSAFREWKGERIERLAGDHVVAAFSLGTLAAAGSSTGVEWVAVAPPDEAPCPDCEDNGLNGAQTAGEEFPTGNTHPPAHPGCRCLLAPSTP